MVSSEGNRSRSMSISMSVSEAVVSVGVPSVVIGGAVASLEELDVFDRLRRAILFVVVIAIAIALD